MAHVCFLGKVELWVRVAKASIVTLNWLFFCFFRLICVFQSGLSLLLPLFISPYMFAPYSLIFPHCQAPYPTWITLNSRWLLNLASNSFFSWIRQDTTSTAWRVFKHGKFTIPLKHYNQSTLLSQTGYQGGFVG